MTGYQDLNGDRQRLYSCHVIKLNRHMRPNPRVFVLCDKFIYWLKGNYQFSSKAPVELGQITGLSVSPGSDQALVVHCVVSGWCLQYCGKFQLEFDLSHICIPYPSSLHSLPSPIKAVAS